ncbi:MAG TPA: ACP S-malonyltransferase [Thermomicrobiales bacterium]|nr:ACP S-malonyltransferase [Thermomicrobiales bacterium]
MSHPIEQLDLGQRVAFVFPGQGSQSVGMGKRLHDISESARRVFRQADEVLGFPLSKLCFEGPADELDDTINAQPAILTVSHAALEALRERWRQLGEAISPVCVAGHSLGEYSALVSAGALDFADALVLVRERGRLMKEAGDERPGGMAAIIGLSSDTLRQVCADASGDGGIVVLANDNCPGQTVISGEIVALERAMSLALDRGARKTVRLAISIASHSPLMDRAGDKLEQVASGVRFHEPVMPIVSNITGRFVTSVDELRRNVGQQIVRPVNWTGSVIEMIDSGVDTFLEIGPSQVLGSLIRRVAREVRTFSVSDLGEPVGFGSSVAAPGAGSGAAAATDSA